MKIASLFLASCVFFSISCKPHALVIGSDSMGPTLPKGATITVDYEELKTRPPARWEILVFTPPSGLGSKNENWVMRVVGLPGDSLVISDSGALLINGVEIEDPYKATPFLMEQAGKWNIKSSYKVPKDCYYMLGDNRSYARDSRYLGALPSGLIKGLVK